MQSSHFGLNLLLVRVSLVVVRDKTSQLVGLLHVLSTSVDDLLRSHSIDAIGLYEKRVFDPNEKCVSVQSLDISKLATHWVIPISDLDESFKRNDVVF